MKISYKLFFSFLILFLLVGGFLISQNPFVKNNSIQNVSEDYLSLVNIPDIDKIYFAAAPLEARPVHRSPSEGGRSGAALLSPLPAGQNVHAAIFPHHTLVATELAEYWQKLAVETPTPSVIVIVGPAHDNQGTALLQTTKTDYQTDFGLVKTDDDLAEKLIQDKVATEETASFVNEHSIGTPLPFIAKLFPDAPIVPVIAKSMAGEGEARALISSLKKNLPADALVIFSMDFSHGLSSDQAFVHDDQTLSLIKTRDLAGISILNETYLDSPFTLQAYLLWVEANGWGSELVWHEHIGRLTGTENEPGTSYFIFFCFTE